MAVGLDTGFLVACSIAEHPLRESGRAFLQDALAVGKSLVLCPQVLAEYLHVVTDARRFEKPLDMEDALGLADAYWNSRDVSRVYPCADSMTLALRWMKEHRLGRKRILDTQLAATYHAAGVRELATTDFRDFSVFGVFELHLLGARE